MAETQLAVDTKPIEAKIVTLMQRAEAIVVRNAAEYVECCAIVIEGRKEIKAIGFVLDPGINSAKEHLDELKRNRAGFVDRVTPIVAIAERKAESYKAEERRQAQVEQDRKNAELRADQERIAKAERAEEEKRVEADRKKLMAEVAAVKRSGEINAREAERLKKGVEEETERRKKAAADQEKVTAANAPQVTVKPNVPTVAGITKRVNWKFEILRAKEVRLEFTMPDSVAIGEKVRRDKDAAKSEREIGGIRVYTEDSI